jgi:menaquinol-cytochrome c reductase iron-sulfur subunit
MENDRCNCEDDSVVELHSRRKVLGWLVTGINLAVVTALAVPAMKFVLAPLSSKSKDKWVDVLDDGSLADGETREVNFVLSVKDGYQTTERKYTVYLYRGPDGLKCFDPACTHLGCRIKFQNGERRYFCPCHGGVFAENGRVVSGPPPRGLVEHPVMVKGGRIYVSRQV